MLVLLVVLGIPEEDIMRVRGRGHGFPNALLQSTGVLEGRFGGFS